MAGKDVGIRIRVDCALRESFVGACKQEDKPTAQVLREFMRAFVSASRNQRGAPRPAAGVQSRKSGA